MIRERLKVSRLTAFFLISLVMMFFFASVGLGGRMIGNIGYYGMIALDGFMGGYLLPQTPWLAWIGMGALLGASAAFWTIAPSYGLKRLRWVVFAPVLILMLYGEATAILAILRMP